MPADKLNPDIAALAAEIKTELLFGQVQIRRAKSGFELRHIADGGSEPGDLRLLAEGEIRGLAQFNANGAFRPLKSAPNLPTGWRIAARDAPTLGMALQHLYPGAVADWYSARSAVPPVTSYRPFTARQTGMYRITTMLDDATAGAVMRACCHNDFCLKRRLWAVGEEGGDEPAKKSIIPCLEPCAILLEFARKITRLGQQETAPVAPESAGMISVGGVGDCDFDAPNNPRRLRFYMEKNRLA